MHYYKRNIGDYAKKAARLSLLQHGVYSQLIDCCYDRETFPTLEEAIDWLWASNAEEEEAVKFVLNKFFTLQSDGKFVQSRIQEEIQNYQGQCLSNAINGKKGGRPKGSTKKPNKTHPVNSETQPVNLESEIKPSGSEINPKPLTTNQEPITKKQIPPKSPKGDHNRFDEFYLAYPRKAARAQALKTWNKLKLDDDLINRILQDIPIRIKSGEFDVNDKTHIPHPSTYLNGRRWEDEITTIGVPRETHQQPGGERRLSAVDRLRDSAAERERDLDQQIRDAETEEALGSGLDAHGGNLWPPADQPVWGEDSGYMGPPPDGILVN
ncbi:MAG: YdaU family protein [Nitrosomonadaceae bacterium]